MLKLTTYHSKNSCTDIILRVSDDNYDTYTVTSNTCQLSNGAVRLTKEQIQQLHDHAFGKVNMK
ncbi:hypothetical protein D3C77_756740 [compost metagenome]